MIFCKYSLRTYVTIAAKPISIVEITVFRNIHSLRLGLNYFYFKEYYVIHLVPIVWDDVNCFNR